MFIGFQDIAIASKVNEGIVNETKFKMKDKLVESGRQTIYANRPQVGSHLKNGAPRTGLSVEPADFAYTKFVLIKTKETFEEKTYSNSELIKGTDPVENWIDAQPFSETEVAKLYEETTYSDSELIRGNDPVEERVNVQPFSETKVAELYEESAA